MSADRFGDSIRERIGERSAPRRKRVVLADRGRTRPVARTIIELEEQTSVGEALVRQLIKAQLRSSLALAAVTVVVLGGLPLLFWMSPQVATAAPFGIRLSWLLLGVLPFPFLVGIGFLSTRRAERHERDFIRMVEQ
jgi:hypothetical protein